MDVRGILAAVSKPPTDDRRPFALVVDDDLLILMSAVAILTDAGFRALEAHNVNEAEIVLVEYADEITLLFTDVQMPGTRDRIRPSAYDGRAVAEHRYPRLIGNS